MSVDIVTKQDLEAFKSQLIREMKELLTGAKTESKRWLRTREIRKLLKISPGTLQNLRINGTLPYTKIGGVIYYAYEDVLRMLEDNKFNRRPDGHPDGHE